jgi:hypothetical protein
VAVPELGVFNNIDADVIALRNLRATPVNHKVFVWFDKANPGGMVMGDNADAGAIAGVVEDKGIDLNAGVPVNYIPQGQVTGVRFEGITKVRAANVAITAGEKVYAVPATGKVTNVATGNTFVGVALTGTSGADDELVVVRLALHGS